MASPRSGRIRARPRCASTNAAATRARSREKTAKATRRACCLSIGGEDPILPDGALGAVAAAGDATQERGVGVGDRLPVEEAPGALGRGGAALARLLGA